MIFRLFKIPGYCFCGLSQLELVVLAFSIKCILIKVPKIAVFNGPDMSVSLSNGSGQTLDKFLKSLDV